MELIRAKTDARKIIIDSHAHWNVALIPKDSEYASALGGKYERQGDYLIPCITLPAEEEQPIGIWGQRHLDYLKQYCKVTYTNLLKIGRLSTSNWQS